MRKLLKKLSRTLGTIMMFTVIAIAFPLIVEAKDQTVSIGGQVYEFDKKSKYEVDSSSPNNTTDKVTTLGSLSISGDISRNYTKDGFTAYEIADDTVFTITYKYSSKLKKAGSMEWHLIEDDKKVVNGIDLDDKIKNGAIILQTSLDAKKWVIGKIVTNVTSDTTFNQDYGINDVQLVNGCYYRIIVAYETKKQLDNSSFLFIDTSDYDQRKNAEVYEFYASYKDKGNEISGKKYTYYVGTKDGNKWTTRTKKNDYVGAVEIDSKDPHYGWNLGAFCLSGYTDIGDSDDIYLKTVGNKIKLSFNLEQDINCLNGNEELKIKSDKKGFDGNFKTKPHDMGHGELIVKYTNEEGVSRITEYSNYLEALAFPGADTTIQLFEEGDYEVHLDYAIDQKGLKLTKYYRTSFEFKIRNGNCMVYIFDAKSGAELSNGDVTENGFRIDTAKSSYPKLTIKKEVLNNTASGLVEDTRFNRAATDGEIFTDEGIYTVTAHNRFDNSLDPAVKIIYIGNNNILTAYTKHLNSSEQYTIAQLNYLVDAGYTISDNGDIIEPVTDPATWDENTEPITSESKDITPNTSATEPATTEQPNSETSIESEKDNTNSVLLIIGAGAGIVALGGIIAVYLIKKKKR